MELIEYKMKSLPYLIRCNAQIDDLYGVVKGILTTEVTFKPGEYYLACKVNDNSILIFDENVSVAIAGVTGEWDAFTIEEKFSFWRKVVLEYNENNKDVAKITY